MGGGISYLYFSGLSFVYLSTERQIMSALVDVAVNEWRILKEPGPFVIVDRLCRMVFYSGIGICYVNADSSV